MNTALLGLSLLTAQPAWALSCLFGVHDASVEEGDQVPPNARFFVAHTFGAVNDLDASLVRTDGAPVEVAVEHQHMGMVLTPVADLQPGASYTLGVEGGDGQLEVAFTVGDAVDEEPPEAPDLVSTERRNRLSEWGRTSGVQAEVEPLEDAARYEWQIASASDFQDAWTVSTVEPAVLLGNSLCSSHFPDYDRRQRYHVRVRAVDAAGNTSAWTSTDGRVGCSTTGGLAPIALGLPLGLLALGRRRV